MKTIIKTKNLKKEFGSGEVVQKVLRGINLEIHGGESVSITGQSGSGKSTLLHQMSLLDVPTSGIIEVLGNDSSDFNYKEKVKFRLDNFGYVFQDYALLPELSAAENVAMPLISRGVSIIDSLTEAKKILSQLNLSEHHNKLPSQLSGGENQRVSIARSIIHDPCVIFADEPTANLDSKNSAIVINMLLDLQEGGRTIVMVTHETEYANLTDRKLEIRDGIICKDTKGGRKK